MDKIVYLFGTGSTMGEMQHQGIEGYYHLGMTEIEKNILQLSTNINGKYKELHDIFGFAPKLDIELIISLLEGCTFSESDRFREVCEEMKRLFRIYLLSQITEQSVVSKISSSLLYIHKKYGASLGENGEELIGVLSINYDSLLEEAYQNVYGGLNLGYPFDSDTYKVDADLPPLLKLHGSFNWRIIEKHLSVSKSFENKTREDEFNGWMPPSVYKKPIGIYENMWNKASQILTGCDTLRVIGSSLRNEDFALLSLLFTSQIKSKKVFNIELIIDDEDATGSDENPIGIMQRLSFLGGMVNFSNLDIYPKEFSNTGNVYKDWLGMKINQIEKRIGASISNDEFLSQRLWREV